MGAAASAPAAAGVSPWALSGGFAAQGRAAAPAPLYAVVDTNILLHGLHFARAWAAAQRTALVVPYVVLRELDGLKRSPDADVAAAARAASRAVEEDVLAAGRASASGAAPAGFLLQSGAQHAAARAAACVAAAGASFGADDVILHEALRRRAAGERVELLTADRLLRLKALTHGLTARAPDTLLPGVGAGSAWTSPARHAPKRRREENASPDAKRARPAPQAAELSAAWVARDGTEYERQGRNGMSLARTAPPLPPSPQPQQPQWQTRVAPAVHMAPWPPPPRSPGAASAGGGGAPHRPPPPQAVQPLSAAWSVRLPEERHDAEAQRRQWEARCGGAPPAGAAPPAPPAPRAPPPPLAPLAPRAPLAPPPPPNGGTRAAKKRRRKRVDQGGGAGGNGTAASAAAAAAAATPPLGSRCHVM
jgi:hypothetical protein